jgi:septal ring factor EnvC (AmiA/AmiB activator)
MPISMAPEERGPMTDPETMAEGNTQGDVTARSVAEHLNSLLLSADSAAQQIVHDAEARAQEQLAEVDRRIRQMEAEAANLASWRQETEQMVRGLAEAIGAFSRDIAEIPSRIDEALGPLAGHVPHVVRQIDQLRAALGMPAENRAPSLNSSTPAPTPAPAAVVSDTGEIQVGWLPGWEDLEDGRS